MRVPAFLAAGRALLARATMSMTLRGACASDQSTWNGKAQIEGCHHRVEGQTSLCASVAFVIVYTQSRAFRVSWLVYNKHVRQDDGESQGIYTLSKTEE